ncbi:hypothetical protein NG791_25320 [Laspinema sp. D1]|uniref:hypothetical protein n=1 Tax=Laspinema palackyanum TaxID=3231601 RepID=UPI0034996348|nr:hypothetical protein [Laspinema sp. D2b]
MERSKNFPPNCPPQKVEKASGEVYRLIDSKHPSAKDFRSWYELYPERKYDSQVKECEAHGLSVFTQKSSIFSLFNRSPRLRKKKVALGKLTPDLGVMLNTPSKDDKLHHTWWVADGKEPWTVFQVIDISTSEQS